MCVCHVQHNHGRRVKYGPIVLMYHYINHMISFEFESMYSCKFTSSVVVYGYGVPSKAAYAPQSVFQDPSHCQRSGVASHTLSSLHTAVPWHTRATENEIANNKACNHATHVTRIINLRRVSYSYLFDFISYN